MELHREKYRSRYSTVLRSTVWALVVAAAVLVATLWIPVLQIYGSSMTPSLQDGEIVLSVKDAAPETGEIIAFYYTKVLVKRVIGGPEDKIFVLGDHRSVSVDSRNVAIGCVSEDQIVGQILFRVWPIRDFQWFG